MSAYYQCDALHSPLLGWAIKFLNTAIAGFHMCGERMPRNHKSCGKTHRFLGGNCCCLYLNRWLPNTGTACVSLSFLSCYAMVKLLEENTKHSSGFYFFPLIFYGKFSFIRK